MTIQHDIARRFDAYARYQAGKCDWSEVQAEQNSLMPRCAAHDEPTSATFSTIVNRTVIRIPVCVRCLESDVSRRMFTDSQRLIIGGIWIRDEA